MGQSTYGEYGGPDRRLSEASGSGHRSATDLRRLSDRDPEMSQYQGGSSSRQTGLGSQQHSRPDDWHQGERSDTSVNLRGGATDAGKPPPITGRGQSGRNRG